MPKTIKEFQLNQSTGEVSVEYSDDSTSKFNAADMVTVQTDPVTGRITNSVGGAVLPAFDQTDIGNQAVSSISLVRGDSSAIGTNAIVSTIKGWMSPFVASGIPFNAVQLSFKVSTASQVLVEICNGAGTRIAHGIVSATTSAAKYTVQLNSRVTSFAQGDVGYIRYSSLSGITGLSYPAGGAYTDITPTAGSYPDKYLYQNTWQNASPVGSYQITFRLLDIIGAAPASEIIVLPEYIYGQIGKESNIYFQGLIAGDASKYQWSASCSIGTQQDERFTVSPAASGDYPLTISCIDPATGNTLGSATTTLRVPAASPAKTIKWLAIGDSTTAAGSYTQEVLNLSGADGSLVVQTIGTQGTAPNKYDGYSGKTVSWIYSDPTSPFVTAGAFNFANYMSSNSFSAVDAVTIHLGINDIFAATSDIAAQQTAFVAMSQIDAMITQFKAFNAAVKIGLMLTIAPSNHQDAFGKNYGAASPMWRYKRNRHIWLRVMREYFGGKTASNIYLIPTHACIDTERNMQTETVAANSRNAGTVTRQSNGVHPALSGYQQMADADWYWMRSVA